ncbi:hypothetical protein ACLKA7_000997 [Drosophila subpalustris]
MGKNTVEAKTWLDKHYGVSAPGKSTICDWYSNFKRSRTSTEDSKLNVKWVPHFLDIEQREKRVADSKSCLDMFNRNPSEFLRRYITMDETWIHHHILESNRSSAEWREAGESRSKRVKASRWAECPSRMYIEFASIRASCGVAEVTGKRNGRPRFESRFCRCK